MGDKKISYLDHLIEYASRDQRRLERERVVRRRLMMLRMGIAVFWFILFGIVVGALILPAGWK